MATNNSVNTPLSGTTGNGNFVGSTSPSLTTPTLGVASATSISFGGSALANYVEAGSWTPGVAFGGASVDVTYSIQTGTYTRIGNVVYYTFNMALSNKGSSTGGATLTGLPITSAAINSMFNPISGSTNVGVGIVTPVFLAVATSGTTGQLLYSGGTAQMQETDFMNNTNLIGNGFYFV